MRPILNSNQEAKHYALLQPLLGGEARTALKFNKKTNELHVVNHFSSLCTPQELLKSSIDCRMSEHNDADSDSSLFQDNYEEECSGGKEIHQNGGSSSRVAGTTSWVSSSCFGCYHAVVTVSWILLSLLLTSEWTIFVYYPRAHGNKTEITSQTAPAITSSTVSSTTMLSLLRSMDEQEIHVVAFAFCLYSLTLGILGWVGICCCHRHLCKQQQQQQRRQWRVTANKKGRNDTVQEQQQQQQHINLRRSATAILMVLNIALVLLLMDEKGLALVAMIACLVALLRAFAVVFLQSSCREEDDNDEATIQLHHPRSTTARLVACIIV
jgi:hypothetical protein